MSVTEDEPTEEEEEESSGVVSPDVRPQKAGRNLRLKKRETPALSPAKQNKNHESQVLPSQSALSPSSLLFCSQS